MTIELTSVNAVLDEIASTVGSVGELKSDRVVMALERHILSGSLPSGTRLPTEAELCAMLACEPQRYPRFSANTRGQRAAYCTPGPRNDSYGA